MTRLFYSLTLSFCLFLSGCVSYSLHQLPPVKTWPPAASNNKTKPVVNISYMPTSAFITQQNARRGGTGQIKGIIVDTFAKSGRFKQVTTQPQGADLFVNAILRSHESGSQLSAIISGATLLVVPMTFGTSYTLELVYRNANGKVIGRTEKTEYIRTWVQLLLVIAIPFNNLPDKIIQQLAQSSIEEAISLNLI